MRIGTRVRYTRAFIFFCCPGGIMSEFEDSLYHDTGTVVAISEEFRRVLVEWDNEDVHPGPRDVALGNLREV